MMILYNKNETMMSGCLIWWMSWCG